MHSLIPLSAVFHFCRHSGLLAAISAALLLLTACGGGGSGATSPMTLSGSVGDGPIVGAQVDAIDASGRLVASVTSNENARYSIVLPSDTEYPVRIVSTGGTDLVTGARPDFDLLSIVVEPGTEVANLNPFTTLIVSAAEQLPGGITPENIEEMTAQVMDKLGFGLDPIRMPDPIATPVTAENAADIVRASEAMGETVRRVRDSLLSTGTQLDGDEILDSLAADIIDGEIDGQGPGAREDIASVSRIVTAQVAVEVLSNSLRVNDYVATERMDTAILITQPDSNMLTGDLMTSASLLDHAMTSVDRARAIQPGGVFDTLKPIIENLEIGTPPDAIAGVLPPDMVAMVDYFPNGKKNTAAQARSDKRKKVKKSKRSKKQGKRTRKNQATTVSDTSGNASSNGGGAGTGNQTTGTVADSSESTAPPEGSQKTSDAPAAACSGCVDPLDPEITLAWEAASGFVEGYKIYYGPSAKSATTLVTTTSGTRVTFRAGADLGAVIGDRVCFRIKSYNAAGSSPFSSAVCSTI